MGEPLTEALARSGLFSADFLSLVAVGEEGGRVPEVMRAQAEYFHEEAVRRLTIVTRLAGLLVWLVYAGFMIWAIFNVASIYLARWGFDYRPRAQAQTFDLFGHGARRFRCFLPQPAFYFERDDHRTSARECLSRTGTPAFQ